jgi:hypothetical protein
MSHLFYFTRLHWDGRGGGIAKLHGFVVPLKVAPILLGQAVEFIDYTPEVHCCELRYAVGLRREMTGDEIRAADEFLRATCKR